MNKIILFYNYILHLLLKFVVDLFVYKKVFIYNFFTKIFYLGDFCFSYYSVKLNNVNFNDATFRFACGGAYGKYFYNYLKNYNKRFQFIDIGSNIGIFSLIAKKNLNCVKTFSIEPAKVTYLDLKKNIKSKNNKVYNIAISHFNGYGFLTFDKKHTGVAKIIEQEKISNYKKKEKIIIKNYKIFNKFYNKDKNRNYIVKIDVEGHQIKVIKEIKKSKIYKYISTIYVETEKNHKSINKLKNILSNFVCKNKDDVIFNKIQNKNLNLMFVKK